MGEIISTLGEEGYLEPCCLCREAKEEQIIMEKYVMFTDDDSITGEGTSSICRKGKMLSNEKPVAIKTYKAPPGANRDKFQPRFERQINVLKELKQPLKAGKDRSLWCERFTHVKPRHIFMILVDWSQDKDGLPRPDPRDGIRYVITELAACSLQDYLNSLKANKKILQSEKIWDIVYSLMLVVACLHSKGLVHMDLKPENLMFFEGNLKLIDVDGCVNKDTVINANANNLSFSPIYCAPEWANFLVCDIDEPTISISPALDVWSVGMTICTVVASEPLLQSTFCSIMRHGRGHVKGMFSFLDWLSQIREVSLPSRAMEVDDKLCDLLTNHLLVPDCRKRSGLAKALSHSYFVSKGRDNDRLLRSEVKGISEELVKLRLCHTQSVGLKGRRERIEDHSEDIIFKAQIGKLKTEGNMREENDWEICDMWIASNGSLCYFNVLENKRLVLLDGHQLHDFAVHKFPAGASSPLSGMGMSPRNAKKCEAPRKRFAFKLTANVDACHDKEAEVILACDSHQESNQWLHQVDQAQRRVGQSYNFGSVHGEHIAKGFKALRISRLNRRMRAGTVLSMNKFLPVQKGELWKLNGGKDKMVEANWLTRESWLSANGTFVYYSMKEKAELIYFTEEDIANATITRIPPAESAKPFSFAIKPRGSDDVDFEPAAFAAHSEGQLRKWLEALGKFSCPQGSPLSSNRYI